MAGGDCHCDLGFRQRKWDRKVSSLIPGQPIIQAGPGPPGSFYATKTIHGTNIVRELNFLLIFLFGPG
jgi:hypothetical protein